MFGVKSFEGHCDNAHARCSVVELAQAHWGRRGYLLVAMTRRGEWCQPTTVDDPSLRHDTSGRCHWHPCRNDALRALKRLVDEAEFPFDVALLGMVELAEGVITALTPTHVAT